MRVFLDTNVVVSALATRGICSDVLRLIVSEYDLLLSETVFGELRRVLGRKFGVPADAVQEACAKKPPPSYPGVDLDPESRCAIRTMSQSWRRRWLRTRTFW